MNSAQRHDRFWGCEASDVLLFVERLLGRAPTVTFTRKHRSAKRVLLNAAHVGSRECVATSPITRWQRLPLQRAIE
jgi:hypothetical protein